MNTLPDQLVKEHDQSIVRETILNQNPYNAGKASAGITIAYMGKIAQWIEDKYFYSQLEDRFIPFSAYSKTGSLTHAELVNKYFESLKIATP